MTKVPTKETIKRRTIADMKALGIYKKQYGRLIDIYSGLVHQYLTLNKKFEVGDRTANQAFKLLRLEEMWSKTRFYVQAVEDLLAYLDEEKRKLIELHYFDGYPIWKVAQEIGIDESTFHRYQTAILILLANRLGL